MRRTPLLLALALLATPVAAADAIPAGDPLADAAERIDAASARVTEAARGLAAAGKGAERVQAMGAAVAAYDAALAALRSGVAEAGAREQALTLDLAERRAEVSRLLAALEAMSRTPQPAQAMHPLGPVGAARAAAMMSRLTPALQDQAMALGAELASLKAARRLRARGVEDIAAGLATLNAAHAELASAMTAMTPDEGPESPTATMMARDSATLTALAAALAASEGAPQPPAAVRDPAERYAWPVDGRKLRDFNEPDAAGVRHPGLVMAAAPFALVSAPADALVRYAGPFLEYGYVVVLEPEPATMIVLAGMAQLRVTTGAAVRRGELLGILGGRPLDVEEYVMLPQVETGAGASETLYIEVRRDLGPIDPEPLFAGENG